jgi:maleate isomerase
MTTRVRLGMLTPSSNTVLEPVTTAMLASLPEVSVHFARFPVTSISLGASSVGQFEAAPMLAAARLLADARVGAIGWNGTSAGWLGLEHDEKLCQNVIATTGIPAVTSVLSLVEVLRRKGVTLLGLVTPYLADVQARIVATFAASGIECVAERHLSIEDNFSFAEVEGPEIAALVREVAQSRPQAITMLCTNFAGAPLVEALEPEVGLPIYDSISVVVWNALRTAGIAPSRVTGWGRLFGESL